MCLLIIFVRREILHKTFSRPVALSVVSSVLATVDSALTMAEESLLFVGNLPNTTTEEVKQFFEAEGCRLASVGS